MAAEVVIERRGEDVLDDLRPLFLALQAHHGSVTRDWAPLRDPDDAWARRRAQYGEWIRKPDAFVLVARTGLRLLGFAFVTVQDPGPTWQHERNGYVDELSVLPAHRGAGLGKRLLDRAEAELAAIGIERLELTVVAPNEAARRFYAREGFREQFVTLVRDRRR